MRNDFSTLHDESFLRRTFEIVSRRKRIALIAFLAVLAAAGSFARYLPDLYRANAVVLVERQLPETFVRAAVSDELESRLHIIKQEILSRARLMELIDKYNLYQDLRAKSDMDTVLDRMRRDIIVQPTGPEQVSGRTKTVSFNLTFIGNNRDVVAEVTNSIASFYVDQNNEMRSEEASRTTAFLRTQLAQAKAELERHEQSVRAFTDRYVGELPQQVGVNLATLERLNTQLRLNGERQLRTLEQREKLLETLPPTVTTATGRTQVPSAAAVRLDRARQELQDLRAKVTDNHPDVRRLKDEIASLEAQTETPTADAAAGTPQPAAVAVRTNSRSLDALDAEMERLKHDESTIRTGIAELERRLEGVPYRQNEFSTISRDHQAAKEQYESLLKRYEEAELAASMETENQGERFRVLEAAQPPVGPSAPNRPRLIILGVLLAVMAAGLIVLVAEQLDTSFHTVDDVRAFTNVPVLASIPRIGPPPVSRVVLTGLATTSVLAVLVVIATLTAYVAAGNEEIVRILVHAG